jgi:ADP-ribose pyrophosphatase
MTPKKKKPAPRTVYRGKFLRVLKTRNWEYVSRLKATGVVVILPLTPDRKIILVEQFRIPVGRNVIELPAGLAGDQKSFATEKLLAAAKRELREETGYAAPHWKLLTDGPSSAGITGEFLTFFLAQDAVRAEKAAPSSDEQIEVHEILLSRLPAWLRRKKKAGCLIDYKIFAALYLALGPEK